MNRQAWMILSLAALFGLRAPLCMAACLESPPATRAAAQPAPSDSPPCHGAPPASPGDPQPSPHRCDCDEVQVVLGATDSHPIVAPVALSPPVAWASQAVMAAAPARGPGRLHPRLPPGRVLLLKSTLLL